ncbi:Transcription factor spt8 [Apophysomyces sp. BC1015]|nr:Transcription factor spt8 [Apophysomyces sp. BC1015]
MSSDEEDLDLQDVSSQLDNVTDDGVDTESEVLSLPPPPNQLPPKRRLDLQLQPNTANCKSYDCVPHAAAVHPSPIYSLATTRCYRWVFTGSEDGYIRKWDFFASINGKTSLTQVQRHHYVDSVTMAGVLSSWWENEEIPPEPTAEAPETPKYPLGSEPPKLSPVYSMEVHSEALWAVQGTENGNINLLTVRHDEGKCHHVLRKHTSPVSVLRLTPSETGVISGSWDKSVLEWDLNTGKIARTYDGHSSQICSAAFQPLQTPNPESSLDPPPTWDQKNPNILLTTSIDGQCLIWDRREPSKDANRLGLPEKTPPWCLSVCDRNKQHVRKKKAY